MSIDRVEADVFACSRQRFEEVVGFLGGDGASVLTHAELEEQLEARGRQLLRQLFQDHLDLRALREVRLDDVVDAHGVGRGAVEAGHQRALATVFGEVTVTRLAYRKRGRANLHPTDGGLNLPGEKHSHGLRRLAAVEASRGSFDGAVDAIGRATGQTLGKRQVEGLAANAAVDFDDFYATRPLQTADPDDVVVISADGKGIVMRPDALRPATAKAAEQATSKLQTRLSKGEKRNRKRIATVGAVYDITPVPRTAHDVIAGHDPEQPAPAPAAHNKWLTASVVNDATEVITTIFDQADRRDPHHALTWIALVDGNNHQIDLIEREAQARQIDVTVLVDFVHVLEYLWRAAWSFYDEADPAAEAWMADKATAVLEGRARQVAAGIRRRATRHGLDPPRRRNADLAAAYLTNKAAYLDYPTALAAG